MRIKKKPNTFNRFLFHKYIKPWHIQQFLKDFVTNRATYCSRVAISHIYGGVSHHI